MPDPREAILASITDLNPDLTGPDVCEIAVPVPTRVEKDGKVKGGDVRIRWKRGDPDGTAKAREAFEALKKAGYTIFAVLEPNAGGEMGVDVERGKSPLDSRPGLNLNQAAVVASLGPDVLSVRPMERFEERPPAQAVARPQVAGG